MQDVVRLLKQHRIKTYGFCVLVVVILLSIYTLDISELRLEEWNPINAFQTSLKGDLFDNDSSGYVGGVPGYQVFQNLWFHNGTFHWFNDEPIPVPIEEVMKGSDAIQQHTGIEVDRVIALEKKLGFKGETIFINSGYGTGSVPKLVEWYYHFATELLMGSISVLSSLHHQAGSGSESESGSITSLSIDQPSLSETETGRRGSADRDDRLPDHMIVPRNGWKDHYGLNEVLIEGTIGSALVDKEAWKEMQLGGDRWIRFDRVLIADRESSGLDPIVQRWNKMAAHALTLGSPTAFEPLRHQMAQHLKIYPTPTRSLIGKSVGKVPKVLYVDRQDTSRRLDPEAHQHLMELFEGMRDEGKVVFTHGVFGEGMTVEEQIQSVIAADIMIGVHGNGLTHELFMAPGGNVIEFFPPESFLRDYQLVSESLSHTHHVVRNDTTYPKSEAEKHPGEQNPWIIHNGPPIPLDRVYIEGLIRSIVANMTS